MVPDGRQVVVRVQYLGVARANGRYRVGGDFLRFALLGMKFDLRTLAREPHSPGRREAREDTT